MTPPLWHPERIKAELRARFGHITALSERWGYHRAAISRTLTVRGYSPNIERLIAEALGEPLHIVWPDRWNPEGTPIPLRPRPDLTAAPPNLHRQKGQAA
jgi:Ner family transcriptional regulator